MENKIVFCGSIRGAAFWSFFFVGLCRCSLRWLVEPLPSTVLLTTASSSASGKHLTWLNWHNCPITLEILTMIVRISDQIDFLAHSSWGSLPKFHKRSWVRMTWLHPKHSKIPSPKHPKANSSSSTSRRDCLRLATRVSPLLWREVPVLWTWSQHVDRFSRSKNLIF